MPLPPCLRDLRAAVLAIALASGCGYPGLPHAPRPVPRGDFEIGGAVANAPSDMVCSGDVCTSQGRPPIAIAALGRYGLHERVDVGATLNAPGAAVDANVALFLSRHLDVAVDPTIAFAPFDRGRGWERDGLGLVSVPVLASLKAGPVSLLAYGGPGVGLPLLAARAPARFVHAGGGLDVALGDVLHVTPYAAGFFALDGPRPVFPGAPTLTFGLAVAGRIARPAEPSRPAPGDER